MQSKVDVHIQRAYDLLQMSGRQNFGVRGWENTRDNPIDVDDDEPSSSQQVKRPRVSKLVDTPKKILDNLIRIVGNESEQKKALIAIADAMSETNNANLLNKMLACIEFLTCNMYCDVIDRIFLEKIEPREPGSPVLAELQELAEDFAHVLQLLKKEEYSKYQEDVRSKYEREVTLIQSKAGKIHRELLFMVSKFKSCRQLRLMLSDKKVEIETFADLYSEYPEQLRQVLIALQKLNDEGFDTTDNPYGTDVLRKRDNEHKNKILGCLEILSQPKHSVDVNEFAHEHLLQNNRDQQSCSLLCHMQDMASKYLGALKGSRIECYTYTLVESYEDIISSINQTAEHIHSLYIKAVRKQGLQPKMIAELIQKRQAVASSSSSGRHRSPSPDVREGRAVASSSEQALIQVYYDKATQNHKWVTARRVQNDDGSFEMIEDRRLGHQEKKERVTWALEAFKQSRVKYDINELQYSLEQEIPRYLLGIQNYYCGTSLDDLPQIAELATDAAHIGRNPDGWPDNVDGSMLSVFSSGNLIRNVVQEVKTNDSSRGPKHLRFVLTRPPGHHAHFDASKNPMNPQNFSETNEQMDRHTHGFCIFNNALVMTHDFTDQGYCVLLIDIDFHKGDGTPHVVLQMNQDQRSKRCVEHVDVYCAYAFPNLDTSETYCQCIRDDGRNCHGTHSHFHGIPSENFASERQRSLLRLVNRSMHEMVRKQQPLIVIVQFGADAHIKDALPPSNFISPSEKWFEDDETLRKPAEYTPAITRDYHQLGVTLASYKPDHEFSVVCVLEGGYAKESLQCSIAGFVQGWSGEALSADLTKARCGGDQYRRIV